MNIWGLQQQAKSIIRSKRQYLERPRHEINQEIVKKFDQGIANRKELINELRVGNGKKK